jgi:hypothetical protein
MAFEESFEESLRSEVLDRADRNGNLCAADACYLLKQHGFSLSAVSEDDHGLSQARLDERNAEALLDWLGY